MRDEADGQVGGQRFEALPGRVQEALGELAGSAKEGLWPCRSGSACSAS